MSETIGNMALLGGLALGLAAFTKYPALVMVLVFLIFMAGERAAPKGSGVFWATAAIPWFLGQAWLTVVHERIHLCRGPLSRVRNLSRYRRRAGARLARSAFTGSDGLGLLRPWSALALGSGAGWRVRSRHVGLAEDVILSARPLVGGFAPAGALLTVLVVQGLVRSWSDGGDRC